MSRPQTKLDLRAFYIKMHTKYGFSPSAVYCLYVRTRPYTSFDVSLRAGLILSLLERLRSSRVAYTMLQRCVSHVFLVGAVSVWVISWKEGAQSSSSSGGGGGAMFVI